MIKQCGPDDQISYISQDDQFKFKVSHTTCEMHLNDLNETQSV